MESRLARAKRRGPTPVALVDYETPDSRPLANGALYTLMGCPSVGGWTVGQTSLGDFPIRCNVNWASMQTVCVGESSHISESCGVALKSPGDGSFRVSRGSRMLSRRANLLDYSVGYSMFNARLTFFGVSQPWPRREGAPIMEPIGNMCGFGGPVIVMMYPITLFKCPSRPQSAFSSLVGWARR